MVSFQSDYIMGAHPKVLATAVTNFAKVQRKRYAKRVIAPMPTFNF